MAIEWSGLGPELLIRVDRALPTPLRAQIEAQLRDGIRSGRLGHGERLPSSRVLSQALGLSRGLVQDCYEQLHAEGYLDTRAGAPTRVSARHGSASAVVARTRPAPVRLIADFQAGVPDLGTVPRDDWAWAVREACRNAANTAFDYGDPMGAPELRDVLAAYLRRVRAADAYADQIVICSGLAQGLGLVLRALADRGLTRVGFEDPGAGATARAAAAWAGGVEAVPVRIDDQGIDVDALRESGAGAVILTPAHQWPTGVVLAPQRRLALVAWAAERNAVVIEDDYDAEFRYDRNPIGATQGLAPDHVALLGTVSKSLAPTFRLGWIVAPPSLVEGVANAKRITDRGSPGIDQIALATLMTSGRYDRHLRRMRIEYGQRRDVLVHALREHAPRVTLTGLAAGFHAVAHLPDEVDERTAIAAAHSRSVGLYGMSAMRFDHAVDPPQLVLGFGNTDQRSIRAGIAAIGDILDPQS
jgi:GntR family transcriptional regulator / MocR family aminotransferase